MNTKYVYWLIVLASALMSLFIPIWYFPFAITFLVNAFRSESLIKKTGIQGLLFFLVCFIFCYYSNETGNQKLMSMLSEVFMNVPIIILILISSLIFSILAMLGAWCGHSIWKIRKDWN